MIDTKRLRQKILDLAIRGELVPQDPNDEPAYVLLERIRKEKKQMVAEGKLKLKDIKNNSVIYRGADNLHYEKVGDNEPVCIENELPFELPEGWAWSRLGALLQIARGGSPRPIKSFITSEPNGVNWIKISDCEKGARYITEVHEKIKPEGVHRSRMVHVGDFLLTNSMSFGRPYILAVDGCIHDGWLVFEKPEVAYDKNYLFYLLSSNYAYNQFSTSATGVTVKNLNIDKVKAAVFPVPPLEEQHRIASVLEENLGLISGIEQNQADLENCLSIVRSKVLDLAIRGKLVKQDPDDEPASALLERIHQEKLQMVAEGKLKPKDVKGDTVIFKGDDNSYYERSNDGSITLLDDIPFDLPEGWSWTRLSTITEYLHRGKSPNYSKIKRYPVFAQKCNQPTHITLEKIRFADPETFGRYGDECFLRDNDIVVNSTGTGTLGRVGLFREEYLGQWPCIVPDSHVTTVRIALEEIAPFVYFFLRSEHGQALIFSNQSGSTNQKELYTKAIEQFLIPLPPSNELARIVSRIKMLSPRFK